MDNLVDRAKAQEGWLEKVARHIPGFSGYKDREDRRNTDKIQRDFMANELSSHKARLQDVSTTLMSGGALTGLSDIDHLCNVIDRVVEKIRHASYGYAGFFDAVKINEAELDRVYQYDMSLVTQITNIHEGIDALGSAASGGQDVKPIIKGLDTAINGLDSMINDRPKVLMGVIA